MSEFEIPLWKRELLNRKQAKLNIVKTNSESSNILNTTNPGNNDRRRIYHQNEQEKSTQSQNNQRLDDDKIYIGYVNGSVIAENASDKSATSVKPSDDSSRLDKPFCGVVNEHINPSTAKKMWQRQQKNVANDNVGTNIPKAYKSPYAKNHWNRSSLKREQNSITNGKISKPYGSSIKKDAKKPATSHYTVDENDDTVEHIQSVKILLGLFGGKAKPSLHHKISDNSLASGRFKKFETVLDKRPALYKHHSEPNLIQQHHTPLNYKRCPPSPLRSPVSLTKSPPSTLMSPVSPLKSPLSPTKSPPSPLKSPGGDTDVASSFHHVSHGIHEKMTQLRRASQTSMEEEKGCLEFNKKSGHQSGVQTLGSELQIDHNKEKVQSSVAINNSSEQKTPVVDQSSDHQQKDGVKEIFAYDKPTPVDLSKTVGDNHNDVCNYHKDIVETGQRTETIYDGINEHSFDEKQQMRASRSTATSELTYINKEQSIGKYEEKQNGYAKENEQSKSGLHSNEPLSHCLTEISQDKQVSKVIKPVQTEEKAIETKSKKPRRRGLNVVDPLAVLQLTKDPILLKEKTNTADLGVINKLSSGKTLIIKNEPDRKAQVAKINRAWDLQNAQNASKGDVAGQKKPLPSGNTQNNVPVTSIYDIPVSNVDNVAMMTSSHTGNFLIEHETYGEFIPVSSIDDVDVGPIPEVVFDHAPVKLKSCFKHNRKVT